MNTPTAEQSEAINSTASHNACVASPGSGKTFVLIQRISKMIADGIPPGEIAVITFTNSGAREIEKRLVCPDCRGAGGHDIPEDVAVCARCNGCGRISLGYAGTLHGLMLRVVRHCADLIGFPKTISVLDEDQTEALLKSVATDLRIKGLTKKEIQAALDLGPAALLGGKVNTGADAVAAEYFQRIRRAGLLDFDSLLKFGAMALQAADEAGCPLPWRHYLWDEFQDSGDDDFLILNRLPARTMFIVGDPDQSIYGFRGAKPQNFARLLGPASGFHVVTMQDNFRCGTGVCCSANQLIANNPGRFPKITKSRTGKSSRVRTLACPDEQTETQQIAQTIRELGDPNDCAVLVRTNALADRFAKVLGSYGFPVRVRPGRDLPGDWKVARAFLALLAAPGNDLLAFWWIERTKGTTDANRFKLEALRACRSINDLSLKLPRDTTPARAVELLGQQGVTPESLDRVKAAITRLSEDATLVDLIFELNVVNEEPEGEGLTVCTMHAAKGREWANVFLPAFEEGSCPNLSKSSVIEEERRLAFVAFTRAKVGLFISHVAKRVPCWGSRKPEPVAPSRFIKDTWPDDHLCDDATAGEIAGAGSE